MGTAAQAAAKTSDKSIPHMTLVSVAGPVVALELRPPGPLTIGRRATHDVPLPDPASRDHALLVWSEEATTDHGSRGQWCIIDTESKHGTRLNGEIIASQTHFPLRHGDLIQIAHSTLQVIDPVARRRDASFVGVMDDKPSIDATMISEVRSTHAAHPSQRHLTLLLECAHAIHGAADTSALAEAVLDALVRGTGLPNAAFLKPMTQAGGSSDGRITIGSGGISVVSHRGAVLSNHGKPNLSRSLIEHASAGVPVRMNKSQEQMFSGASIIELGIDEAMCVPIMLGSTVAGYIYLDSRRQDHEGSHITQEASDFTLGLSQITAMAMANLMRLDLQKRVSRIEGDIAAAAEAQRWVLPVRQGSSPGGGLSYLGESRPGKIVSGDFFDVIRLDGDRLAVTLGDVSGKGVAASVLMTVAQGFLHAALAEHGDPARAARDLNAYIAPRGAAGRFLTLWAGVFDAASESLTYVDAGHGYAILAREGELTHLNEAGGMPIGILSGGAGALGGNYENAQIEIPRGSRVLVVSDGLIEQTGCGEIKGAEFGIERVRQVLQGVTEGEDEVSAIFQNVDRYAGRPLADDATAVLVRREAR